jgi:hypothetical protein
MAFGILLKRVYIVAPTRYDQFLRSAMRVLLPIGRLMVGFLTNFMPLRPVPLLKASTTQRHFC